MSDKMFRYLYVYSKGGEDLNMEMFPAGPFLDQMLGEYVVLLGENGYQFDIDISDKEAEIYVDLQGMKRVTDNVFTNIRKYSDKSKSIDIRVYIDRRKVRIYFRNYINPESSKAESTHIGTLTCQKMAEEMNGSFTTCKKGKVYEATLICSDSGTYSYTVTQIINGDPLYTVQRISVFVHRKKQCYTLYR